VQLLAIEHFENGLFRTAAMISPLATAFGRTGVKYYRRTNTGREGKEVRCRFTGAMQGKH
jgi:hypothetical protein